MLTAWGTDVALAERVPALFRPVVSRARCVICPSQAVADAVRGLGARRVVVVPAGVEIPQSVGPAEDPPHVLYVGRLSAEKGVEELAEATRGLPRVVVGDGPLRRLFPDAVGLRAAARSSGRTTSERRSSSARHTARATASSRERRWRTAARSSRRRSAACSTSSRTASRGCSCLRATRGRCASAIERLLGDAPLRERLGRAARQRVVECCSWEAATDATLAVYGEASARRRRMRR